eukprot:gene62534-85521_t
MESRDEIDARLNLYNQQLQQVNQLLTLDGQNPQFLSLKSDLEKVISLTGDLLKQQKANDPNKSGSEVVEVPSGERVYAGVVTGIINQTEYRIKYYEFDTEVSLPVSSFHRAPTATLNKADIKIGFKCQCKFATDQNFYDAV